MPKEVDKPIDPDLFYSKIEGIADHPKKTIITTENKTVDEINKKREYEEALEQELKPTEIMPAEEVPAEPKPKVRAKTINGKSKTQMLLTILIVIVLVFGLFFVWAVGNDKFKSDYDFPDYECADVQCSEIDLSKIDASCICESPVLTCPAFDSTPIINAISNLNFTN